MSEESENSVEKQIEDEESEDEDPSYIRTRRGVIHVNKGKQEKKPDRLNGEYSYQNTIKQRVIGPPCMECKMECDLRIAERFRQDNYLNFWGKLKTWEDRRSHVRRLVQVLRIPHPKNKTRKKFLRKYYLEMEDGFILVCKTMFFNTLAISAKFIETTLQKLPDNVIKESEMKLVNNPNVMPKSLDLSSSKPPAKEQLNKETENTTANQKNPITINKVELPIESQLLDTINKQDMKPPCSCPEECGKKISPDAQVKIYEHFWLKLQSWEERKLFIINTIEKDRYTSIRTFVLPTRDGGHITVCQEMYLNTLALSEKIIEIALPKTEPIKRKIYSFEPEEIYGRHEHLHNVKEINTPYVTQNEIPKNITKELCPLPVKRAKLAFTPLKPPCSCELQCKIKLTDDVRQQIHKEFWNLPQIDQKHFILSTIHTQINKNKLSKEKTQEIKYFMLPFHCENVVVCKEMYLQTLAVNEDFVTSTVKNINHDGSIIEEEDGVQLTEMPFGTYDLSQFAANDRNFIDCADLLESQIKEDVLHSEKSQVKRVRKSRTSKKLGPPCPFTCRLKCSSKFDEEKRRELHSKFWCTMDWQGRKQFVMNTVKEFPIKNRSIPGRLTKRNFSRIYTLPDKDKKITVCQKMYFNTLSICSKFVSTVHIWASQVKW